VRPGTSRAGVTIASSALRYVVVGAPPYARDMFGNPSAWNAMLGLAPAVVLGLAIVGFAVGIAWLRRITRGTDDSNNHWRYRR